MKTHTATPWELDDSDWPLIINGPDEETPNVIALLYCQGTDESGAARNSYDNVIQYENAKKIVEAVNQHDILIAALRSIVNTTSAFDPSIQRMIDIRKLALDALNGGA